MSIIGFKTLEDNMVTKRRGRPKGVAPVTDEERQRIEWLYKHTDMGYDRIAAEMGKSKSTIQRVVKAAQEAGRLPKIINFISGE